jgi:hypothetical protein
VVYAKIGKISKTWEGVIRQLKWSKNNAGTLNGKVGHVTLFTVAYYPERGYFVDPKLPGFNKTIPVNSEEVGKRKAEELYQRYFDFLRGAEWYQDHDYREPISLDSWKKDFSRSTPNPHGNGEAVEKRRAINSNLSAGKRFMKKY